MSIFRLSTGAARARGGWYDDSRYVRFMVRFRYSPDYRSYAIGFRLVRTD